MMRFRVIFVEMGGGALDPGETVAPAGNALQTLGVYIHRTRGIVSVALLRFDRSTTRLDLGNVSSR